MQLLCNDSGYTHTGYHLHISLQVWYTLLKTLPSHPFVLSRFLSHSSVQKSLVSLSKCRRSIHYLDSSQSCRAILDIDSSKWWRSIHYLDSSQSCRAILDIDSSKWWRSIHYLDSSPNPNQSCRAILDIDSSKCWRAIRVSAERPNIMSPM